MTKSSDLQDAKVVYGLYVAGYFIPVLAAIGMLYAYYADRTDPVVQSHLRFQTDTFWIGLLLMIVGSITSPVLIGYAILLFWFGWTAMRIYTGFMLAQESKPVSKIEVLGMVAKG